MNNFCITLLWLRLLITFNSAYLNFGHKQMAQHHAPPFLPTNPLCLRRQQFMRGWCGLCLCLYEAVARSPRSGQGQEPNVAAVSKRDGHLYCDSVYRYSETIIPCILDEVTMISSTSRCLDGDCCVCFHNKKKQIEYN